MPRPPLPPARTTADALLHDIATSLRTLVDRTVPPQPGGDVVQLEEPAPRKKPPVKKATAKRQTRG